MKILWIIPKWTLPINDGARVATDSLLRNTIAAGAIVDVLCLAPSNEIGDHAELKKHWDIRDVFTIHRTSAPKDFKKIWYYFRNFIQKPLVPLTFAPFFDHSVIHQTMEYSRMDNYDFILLDGLHLGALFLNKELPKGAKLLYRAHNIEVDLWKKAYQEKNNLLLKLLLLYQSKLVGNVESRIIKKVSFVAPIAQEDHSIIKQQHPGIHSQFIPLGLNFKRTLPHSERQPIQFLFIGKLDWAPNKDGLLWLLKEVWPKVIENRPEAVLKIVGSGDGRWLESFRHMSGINIVGFVEDIRDAYKDCHFTVVPLTYGSGTRIKVIESFVMNRRLISTKMGVQGANLREIDFEHAESKEEWIDKLSTIKFDQDISDKVEESRKYMAAQFCEENIGKRFYEWLSTVS
jgi:glycosyltransferase involved in cell wall biosynthesis